MIIDNNTTVYQIAELMGTEADRRDGEIMMGLLLREGFPDTDECTPAKWSLLINEVCRIRNAEDEITESSFITTGKKLVVTMSNGETATRATQNQYRVVVVAHDKNGKLFICSAHYDLPSARGAISAVLSGRHVNFNYPKRSDEPKIVFHADYDSMVKA